MALEKLADYLYVSKQLNERLAKQAAQYEIKTVICNRPDGEEPGQPDFETVRGWLQAAGIENVVYLPVTMDSINDQLLEEFRETVAKSPAPILAYCRSGTRSTLMWALNQAKLGVETNSLIKAAELVGIDLSGARERIEAVRPKKG
ncbi:TIGR01244 family sulfur transferase [Kingella sp. SNUBH-2017]|uniref:TIGR01244 family sulfur transferase n=1 Tax=Kingella pumchi TaxID=2779506 RepID=A0ABS9NNB9_9NEIS|nr:MULTISPECIES: TIGR01244 family sulfur transferase [Kingella]MCG6504282.1 TIGR01244 family sulfur transferase [Kingella pumchi]MDD2183530.1 TIGR01244 family sulfur transferase [Kingella sp. SNUBH-2017]